MNETLNSPCSYCGRLHHHVEANRNGVTRCVSLPAPGFSRPGFSRVVNAHGQEVLVRVSRQPDEAMRDLVSLLQIEVGGAAPEPLLDGTHGGQFRPGALDRLLDKRHHAA